MCVHSIYERIILLEGRAQNYRSAIQQVVILRASLGNWIGPASRFVRGGETAVRCLLLCMRDIY